MYFFCTVVTILICIGSILAAFTNLLIFYFFSRILGHSIPIYLIPSNRIGLSPAKVTAVAFNSVNVSTVAAFYDAHVVPAAVAVPVEEDNVSGPWFVLSAAPLAFLFEPVYSVGYQGESWDHASFNIAALIGAP